MYHVMHEVVFWWI